MVLEFNPWVCIVPGMAIFLTVLAFNLFGDGWCDAFDSGSEDVREEVVAGHDEATGYRRELVLVVAAWFGYTGSGIDESWC